MFKFILSKTTYKKFNDYSKNALISLLGTHQLYDFFCSLVLFIFCISPFMPCFIIAAFEDIEVQTITSILLITWESVTFVFVILLLTLFRKAFICFCLLISEKIYYLTITKKGKIFSKGDFKTIKEKNDKLFDVFSTQRCMGYCFSACFLLCQILQKGYIEFIAVRTFAYSEKYADEEENKEKFPYTIHVIYVHNGWAFDTYSCRQYPVKKLYEIYQAKHYKTVKCDELKDISYDDFKAKVEPDLIKWCNQNDCCAFSNPHDR